MKILSSSTTNQSHFQRHSLKYLGILISLITFYCWNLAKQTVTTPYEVVLMHPKADGSGYEYISFGKDSVTNLIETPAQPQGGFDSLFSYLAKNISYPQKAYEQGVSGEVFVQFTIETDGSVSQVNTAKGIGNGCDEEAERLMRNCPKWLPASHQGELVAQRMILPIQFGKKP